MSKAWSRDVWVDPHTFGGTKACEVLADMLNNNVVGIYDKHRILAFITDVTIQFKYISYIPHSSVRERSMLLMKEDLFKRIENMEYGIKVKSYIKNVVAHHYRKNLEGWEYI